MAWVIVIVGLKCWFSPSPLATVAAAAAFTTPGGDALQLVVYRHLLYNLLAIGQQDLAWTVAKAAYR
jgi:hypothetical protein